MGVLKPRNAGGEGKAIKNSDKFSTEKREVGRNSDLDPPSGEPSLVPVLYVSVRRIAAGNRQGLGSMMSLTNTLKDHPCEADCVDRISGVRWLRMQAAPGEVIAGGARKGDGHARI